MQNFQEKKLGYRKVHVHEILNMTQIGPKTLAATARGVLSTNKPYSKEFIVTFLGHNRKHKKNSFSAVHQNPFSGLTQKNLRNYRCFKNQCLFGLSDDVILQVPRYHQERSTSLKNLTDGILVYRLLGSLHVIEIFKKLVAENRV